MQIFLNIIADGNKALSSLPLPERFIFVFWLLGPFFFLIERTPGDAYVTIIALLFLLKSLIWRDGSWLGFFWVKAIFFFWGVCLLSAVLSPSRAYALGESLVWIRFPVFAIASTFWFGRCKNLLNLMLLSTFFAVMLMCGILILEIIVEGPKERLSWPYGDLVSGNFLAKVGLPIVVILSGFVMSSSHKNAMYSIPIFALIAVMTFLTGERINFLIVFCSAVLVSWIFRENSRKFFVFVATITSVFLVITIWSPDLFFKYVTTFIAALPTGIESNYYRAVAAGWVVFENYPSLGIGPGNFRYLCSSIVGANLGLDCHNHPHNFYSQLLAETGFIGFLSFVLAITSIVHYCWSQGRFNEQTVFQRVMWVIPFALFWPIKTNADFFGQWNNIFLWSAVALALAVVHNKPKGICK